MTEDKKSWDDRIEEKIDSIEKKLDNFINFFMVNVCDEEEKSGYENKNKG